MDQLLPDRNPGRTSVAHRGPPAAHLLACEGLHVYS